MEPWKGWSGPLALISSFLNKKKKKLTSSPNHLVREIQAMSQSYEVADLDFGPITWSSKIRTLKPFCKVFKIWPWTHSMKYQRLKFWVNFIRWEIVIGHESNLWCRENKDYYAQLVKLRYNRGFWKRCWLWACSLKRKKFMAMNPIQKYVNSWQENLIRVVGYNLTLFGF